MTKVCKVDILVAMFQGWLHPYYLDFRGCSFSLKLLQKFRTNFPAFPSERQMAFSKKIINLFDTIFSPQQET